MHITCSEMKRGVSDIDVKGHIRRFGVRTAFYTFDQSHDKLNNYKHRQNKAEFYDLCIFIYNCQIQHDNNDTDTNVTK